MEPEPRKKPIRYQEIDLLRFLAAFSVVLYHYTFRGHAEGDYNPVAYPALASFTRYGYLGVHLFFIISGYVVLLSAQGKTVRQFFVSRVTRLYPAFLVACTLTFLVEMAFGTRPTDAHMASYLHGGIGQYVYNLTMLSGFLGVLPLDGAYWSLTIEITFYFLIAVLMGLRLLPHLTGFLALWLAYIALPLIGLPTVGKLLPDLLFPDYAPLFIAGMLFYLLQQPAQRTWRNSLLLLLAFALSVRAAVLEGEKFTQIFHADFSPSVIIGAVSTFFGLFGLIISRRLNLARFTWLTWLGSLTYPLYLVHSDIGFIAFHRLAHWGNKYFLLGVLVSLMLLLAYLIHVLVEKPLSKILGRTLPKLLARMDEKDKVPQVA